MTAPRTEIVKTIFYSKARNKNIVGYCDRYNRWVTLTQMRTKGCLEKQCDCFHKCYHSFWIQHDRLKTVKHIKKELGIPVYERVNMSELLSAVNE